MKNQRKKHLTKKGKKAILKILLLILFIILLKNYEPDNYLSFHDWCDLEGRRGTKIDYEIYLEKNPQFTDYVK